MLFTLKVDLKNVFSQGQAYVALSRARLVDDALRFIFFDIMELVVEITCILYIVLIELLHTLNHTLMHEHVASIHTKK